MVDLDGVVVYHGNVVLIRRWVGGRGSWMHWMLMLTRVQVLSGC